VGSTKNITRGNEMEFSTSVIFRICGDFILAAVRGVGKASANSAERRAPWIRGARKRTEC